MFKKNLMKMKTFAWAVLVSASILLLTGGTQQSISIASASNTSSQKITVVARGNTGNETVNLSINGSRVASWRVGLVNKSYNYTFTGDIYSLRVGHTSGSWPNAVIVRGVVVDNDVYLSTDLGTFSVGSWDQDARCGAGYKRSMWLSCDNAFFDYDIKKPDSTPNQISVRARGNQGTETVNIIVNGQVIASWKPGKSYQTYSITYYGDIESLRVGHSSGGWPNAIIVDYAEVDGARYQSESYLTLSEGSWTSSTGCARGFKVSEWISCNNGFFDYFVQ